MSKDTKPMLDKGTIRMGTVTKIVLALAIIILAVSLVISFVKPDAASILLSFFSTVIVSWLISNDASEKENERTNKKKQEDLAKVSHRHLGDVERSALSIEQYIKDFTYDFESHQDMSADAILLFLKSLDSRMDDLKDRITSTNRDWFENIHGFTFCEKDSEISDISFQGEVRNCLFSNITVNNCKWENAYVESIQFDEAHLTGAGTGFYSSKVLNITFGDCIIDNIHICKTELNKYVANYIRSHVKEITHEGDTRCRKRSGK